MKKIAVCAAIAVALGTSACSEQSDPEIVADANEAIAEENVPGSISVASNDGVVTLTGIVPSMQAKDRAQEVVNDVDGVERVVNNLRTTAGDAPVAGHNEPMRDDNRPMREDLGAPRDPVPGADVNRDPHRGATDPAIDGAPAPR